ncbi:MAG: molybdopterin-dependent oxidoreductase, partial [Devosia sp.]|nr:molybdopterin-dependent oxidoreductase [Devosia sp.]
HEVYPWLKDMAARHKKMVFIDPVRTEACKMVEGEWLAIQPQTDVAMMLGMAHTLAAEKLHDEKFLAQYTVGFDKFLPYLMGQEDGVAKTAEWASAICGVPAETIRDLARRCAKGRTMLASGWSMQRQHHGEQVHWMLVTLAAMLGQIGLPGGGFTLSYHYASAGGPTATGAVVGGVNILSPANIGKDWTAEKGSKTIPVARIVDMLEHPGQSFDYNGTVGKYPDVRLTYWVGGNPFHHHQDRNRQVAAWKKFETFIVQDFQWTASARFADIVLPATTTAERNDLEMVGPVSNTHIMALKQIVPPVGEARNDYDIFRAIATRLGFEQAYSEGKDETAWIRTLYDGAATMAKGKNVAMPDFDTFWKNGLIEFQIGEAAKKYVRHSAFRADPLLNPLGTPSGKIEITSARIAGFKYDDCPAHPTWMEPFERASAPGAKYKLHINTKHPPFRLHSQLCGTVLREKYQVSGREPILLHPDDATARGIKDGDVVRVFNDRGQILAGAKISQDLLKGVAVLSEGGWYDPVEPGKPNTLCAWGDANVLTKDVGSSKLAQATCAATIAAEVEKYTGPLPPVKVFTAPAA